MRFPGHTKNALIYRRPITAASSGSASLVTVWLRG